MSIRVLLVDDEEMIRKEFAIILEGNNYTFDSAANSREGMNKISASYYDIVMLDIRMPGMDNRFSKTAGIELLKLIKKERPLQPVLMVSAINDVATAVEAMKSGADDYIEKDAFSTETLFSKIDHALKKSIAYMIKQGESETVEFKSSLKYDLINNRPNSDLGKVIAKSIVGFINSKNGGHLFIGINDGGGIIGIQNDIQLLSKKTEDAFITTVFQLIITHIGKDFCDNIHPSIISVEGKSICSIKVNPGCRAAWFADGNSVVFYLRLGPSTRPLNSKETHEYISRRFEQN